MSLVLDVKDLSVGFRQDGQTSAAVRGVSFTVDKGETVALVGESGSGKSVTALSTVSLLPESAEVSGSIKYAGDEMVGADARKLRQVRGNDISFIFQEPMTSLNPLHTLEKQLMEGIALHRVRLASSEGFKKFILAIEELEIEIPRPCAMSICPPICCEPLSL